jgi:hypothetical protein
MPEILIEGNIAGYSVLMLLPALAIIITIYDKIEMRKRRKTHKNNSH